MHPATGSHFSMTRVYLFKTTWTKGLLVISFVWVYTSSVAVWPHTGHIYTSLVGMGLIRKGGQGRYVSGLNFKSCCFLLFLWSRPCPCPYLTHLNVICRHFSLMSLFQGHVPCQNFTLTGLIEGMVDTLIIAVLSCSLFLFLSSSWICITI